MPAAPRGCGPGPVDQCIVHLAGGFPGSVSLGPGVFLRARSLVSMDKMFELEYWGSQCLL